MNYLNKEQLAKTLTSLFNLYDANRDSKSTYENEAEFCSFYVLLHLGSNSQPMVNLYCIFIFFSFSLFFVAVLHWVLYMWNINCSGPRGSHFLGGFVMFLPLWWNLRKFAFPERFYGNFHFPLFYVLCLIIGNCFFLTSIWNVFISILVSKTERWSASATDFSG